MPATVQIIEKNGAGGDATDKTSGTVRFKKADNATVNTANPMQLPDSGSDWSFEKWLRLNVSGGTYTEITDIVAYTDGSGFGTGINAWARAEADYATPTLETSNAGYADLFSYTSGSPLSLGAGPFTSTGEKGSHLVMALEVTDAASGGALTPETLTLAWDEI